MYIPTPFAETNQAVLHDAIERYSFALLISGAGSESIASHLPLLLDRSAGEQGTLVGHMARANPQWQQAAGQTVLAVFSGPHAYISPTWYAAERVVPTWNYVAVHAYGRLQPIDSLPQTIDLLRRTVSFYEANLPQPWKLDGPADLVEALARQVVAFQIPIDRLDGKWKLNQNHPPERRERVATALDQQGGDDPQAIARLMRQTLSHPA